MNLLAWNVAVVAQGMILFVVIAGGGLIVNRLTRRGRDLRRSGRSRDSAPDADDADAEDAD